MGRSMRIIRLDGELFGLYISGWRNDFGTPLYMTGTLEEVMEARRSIT